MRKTRKILATLLTFAMLFGSSLTVFADEGEEYYHYGSNISNIGNTEINASISQIPTQISQTLTHNPNGNTPSSNPVEEPTKIEEVHEHSYSWVTVQEASAGQDGIEEYRCSCGAVAERNVIPAGMAMVKDLVRQIETAPENSTVEIKTEYFTRYTAYIMNALRKRPDVSLKTTFKDYDKDGSIKTFTIPAGKAPDDGELFYGFTYLVNLYGWDE